MPPQEVDVGRTSVHTLPVPAIGNAFPLGGSDASVIAIAERRSITTILTTDRRHFAAVRPRHVGAFELLP